MTNAQKWVAAFLGVFLFLFVLAKLTKQEDNYFEESKDYNSTTTEEPAKDNNVSGLTLINRIGCTSCHGTDLTGTKLAPNLHGVKKYWTTKNALVNYLKNPQSYSRDERFEEYQKQYRSMMPPFNTVDEEELGKIADYILSLED